MLEPSTLSQEMYSQKAIPFYLQDADRKVSIDMIFFLYFRTMHVVIFILFKPTRALFLKHIHIHI
jgi:hypothetical protein